MGTRKDNRFKQYMCISYSIVPFAEQVHKCLDRGQILYKFSMHVRILSSSLHFSGRRSTGSMYNEHGTLEGSGSARSFDVLNWRMHCVVSGTLCLQMVGATKLAPACIVLMRMLFSSAT